MEHDPHDELDSPRAFVERIEWAGDTCVSRQDVLAREEPLGIHVAGVPLAVVMRTPGHDLELVRGFLLTERIVEHDGQIVSIRHCDRVDEGLAENSVVQVVLAPDAPFDPDRLRRNLFVASSCGICGKTSLSAALQAAPPLLSNDTPRWPADRLYALPGLLQRGQAVFAETGGLHGAALFSVSGGCLGIREDVGRHNAVDKVIGHVTTRHPGDPAVVLLVSGRISFEIVQKALAARIPIVAAISAPTSLAVELAVAAGVTLVGFLRDERMCIYSHPQRIVAPNDEL